MKFRFLAVPVLAAAVLLPVASASAAPSVSASTVPVVCTYVGQWNCAVRVTVTEPATVVVRTRIPRGQTLIESGWVPCGSSPTVFANTADFVIPASGSGSCALTVFVYVNPVTPGPIMTTAGIIYVPTVRVTIRP